MAIPPFARIERLASLGQSHPAMYMVPYMACRAALGGKFFAVFCTRREKQKFLDLLKKKVYYVYRVSE